MVRSFFWSCGISVGVPLSMLALTVVPSQAQIDRQVSTAAVNSHRPGAVILALLVTLQPPETGETPAPEATGWLVSGNFGDFPILYRDDRSFAKIILNGGVGGFSDTNPWFGSARELVSGPYQPTGTVTWGEFYLEPGLAGITRLGDAPISQNFLLQGVGAIAFPGSAIRQAVDYKADPWITLQLSLFMFF